MREQRVVTCFLESDGDILLLRRSDRVGTYQGRWAGVSGYIDGTADEQALVEIAEETGLAGDDIALLKKGEPLEVDDEGLGMRWVVHPYLFQVRERGRVRIDWEHREARWINPADMGIYQTVPMLQEALARVYKG